MTFDEFVSRGWADHGADAEGVFARLPEGIPLIGEPGHIAAFAALATHVSGEHLGRWAEGVAILDRLERLAAFDVASPEGKAVARSKAVLHRCAGDRTEEERCFQASRSGGEVPEASDRIRVLAVAAAALAGQKRIEEAARDLEAAVALAGYGPASTDPAARALAIAGNNLACELEDLPALTKADVALMLRAAAIGREFWGIAGGWTEAERAEYRLAMSHIRAGDPQRALDHAARCLSIVSENGSDPGEEFFAHEAFSRARIAAGEIAAARLERDAMAALLARVSDGGFRRFCEQELAKLDRALEGL